MGDVPFHGNRYAANGKSVWHNYLGQRRHNIGWGDGHVEYWRFPPSMEDPFLWTLFVDDRDTTHPLRPIPTYAWW